MKEKLDNLYELSQQVENELKVKNREVYLDIYIRTVPAGIDVLCSYYDQKTDKTYNCDFLLYPNGDTSTSPVYDEEYENFPHWIVTNFEEDLINRVKEILIEKSLFKCIKEIEEQLESAGVDNWRCYAQKSINDNENEEE